MFPSSTSGPGVISRKPASAGGPHRSPDSWDQLSWSPVRGHFLSAALWGSSWHFVTRHRDVMVKKMFLDKQKHFQHWLLITQWQRLKSFSPNSLDTASANTLQLRLRRNISDKKTKEFYENQTRVEIREQQKLNHLLRHSTDRTLGFKLSLKKKNPKKIKLNIFKHESKLNLLGVWRCFWRSSVDKNSSQTMVRYQ